ncbi:hypothetical protein EJV47_15450 [Hymenobacter gummosus]|uniref:Uncharacterized protein n=1 Tax=Hymenobacter gummosus TaxID=1776032 RepID=A0A3S0JGD2_9BACT|nr:hypothetical protein [Hymenobacter gummosus]RTQ48984.1 hypothetical protein EJV47_15450 [Hymenobacter gummosus]
MAAALTDWPAGPLVLALPAAYQLAHHSTERVPLPFPPETLVQEDFWRWEAPGGAALHLFYWQPRAPRPGGPMRSVRTWPAQLAGQPVQVHETDLFMGWAQRALVTHLPLPAAQLMLCATGLSPAEFETVLEGARLA